MERMTIAQVGELRDALMQVASLKSADERQMCVEEVHGELGKEVVNPAGRKRAVQADLIYILRELESERGGLTTFLRAVATIDANPSSVRRARQILAQFELEALLVQTPPSVITQAASEVLDAAVTEAAPAAVVRQIGWQPAPGWNAPAMLAFAALVSDHPNVDGAAIQDWISTTAYDIGLTGADHDSLRRTTLSFWTPVGPGSQTTVLTTVEQEGPEVPTIIKIGEPAAVTPPDLVWGGVPPRNRYFVGRRAALDRLETLLARDARASVLPKASVQGAGGVGKTQLAVEYVYQNQQRYQIVWWINAEDIATVRSSLSALADRLSVPAAESVDQRIRSLLDYLATTPQSWLLVYDNATDPSELAALTPSANLVGELGHVIITTRNSAWVSEGASLELGVFRRPESIKLLHLRMPDASEREADMLAEQLDDLPLALEQAASWLLTMPSSIDEYVQDLDRHATVLLSEGKAREYNGTVLTVVSLALPQLRARSEAAMQLLELLVNLAPEPVSTRLLWEGRAADLTEPLRSMLQERNDISRAARHLGALGLARIDSGNKRVQIHRLVHLVVREGLTDTTGMANAQRLLSAANPGFPDERSTWPRHAEITPHLRFARMIDGNVDARRTVLDQVRYLYNVGDFESCRTLVAEALDTWDTSDADGKPSEDALTLLAVRRYGDALRALGDPRAAAVSLEALERMRTALGEPHPYTMGAANGVGADLRRSGQIAAALELDRRNLERHRELLGDADPSTLRIMNSLAMDLRLTGDFNASYTLNVEVEQHARTLEDGAIPIVLAQEAQARDLYLLGRYAEAAASLETSLPAQRRLLGDDHLTTLRATCVYVASLRKLGRLDEAVANGRDNYLRASRRFGPGHIMTAECGMNAANALRARGDVREAYEHGKRSLNMFRSMYGSDHPVVWCASVNVAAILRARDLDQEAEELNVKTLEGMRRTLPAEHPYLLSARTGVVMNLVRAHQIAEAQPLSAAILADSRRIRGPEHAYTLYCMVNAAVDLIQTGQGDAGIPLLNDAISLLADRFGEDHPEVQAARNRRRIECDIETISLA